MKIAFILTSPKIVASDGICSQAMTWKKGLELIGHEVTLVNMWENYDWKNFDAILLFSHTDYLRSLIGWLHPINPNLVVAPIFDPIYHPIVNKIFTHMGSDILKLHNHYQAMYSIRNKVKLVLARSNFEKKSIEYAFSISPAICKVVPLSCNVNFDELIYKSERKKYCLHMSLLCDDRKNVQRLIKASEKYNFKLKLCGMLRNQSEKEKLNSWLEGTKNVEYLGFVSEEEKLRLYTEASVFALPSTVEGVGIVALDAAGYGCNVVITDIGGPKEYYEGMATIVNPHDVDSIGEAIVANLDGKCNYQPQLSDMIKEKYSLLSVSKLLAGTIEQAIN